MMNEMGVGNLRTRRVFSLLAVVIGALLLAGTFPFPGGPGAAAQGNDTAASGTIAYVRATEGNRRSFDVIRLVEADGSNDRLLYALPDPDFHVVYSLDWRPDGQELAFTTNQEGHCSFYESDVFAIRADGGGLRRVTNAPSCSALAAYPQGMVTVDVVNNSLQPVALFVYVEGAPGAKPVNLLPFAAATVTFESVADFGDGFAQFAVASQGPERWFSAGVAADVVPGSTVHAGTLSVAPGTGALEFGARDVSWRADGGKIGFTRGLAGLYETPAYPGVADFGAPLLGTTNLPIFISNVDRAPTADRAAQVLYPVAGPQGAGIYLAGEGSGSAGTKLVDEPDLSSNSLVLDVEWLPDGSGFLFTATDFYLDYANLFEYRFATGDVTQLTAFDDEFAAAFAVSPDGQEIVFERMDVLLPGPGEDLPIDLWMMARDGSNMRLFMANAATPDWTVSRATAPGERVYLPAVFVEPYRDEP